MTPPAVERILSREATRGERAIAVLRAALGLAAMLRSSVVWADSGLGPSAPAVLLSLAALLGAVLFSLYTLIRLRRREATPALLLGSVAMDVLVCTVALASNPLAPGPLYAGLLFMPDLAALVLVAAAAGLRLSPRAALVAGPLAGLSLFLLLWLDAAMGWPLGAVGVRHLSALSGVLLAGSAIGVFGAIRTRQLATEGAFRALSADRAERSLGGVLREHHDVRTVLSSASLNADLLVRATAEEVELSERAAGVRRDLDAVNETVASLKVAGAPVIRFDALPERAGGAVDALMADAATSGERIVAWGRLILGGVAIGRSFFVWRSIGWEGLPDPARLSLAALAVAVAFSIYVLLRYRSRPVPGGLLAASIVLDAGVCLAALSTNVIWPEPGVAALVASPELAYLLVPLLSSSLRFSLGASLLAGMLNLASLGLLLVWDVDRSGLLGTVGLGHASTVAAFLLAATAIAARMASRASLLSREAAARTLAAEGMQAALGRLLRRHVDVRSLLTAATLGSEELERALVARPDPGRDELCSVAGQLRRDLGEVGAFIGQADATDLLSVDADSRPEPAAISDTLEDVLPRIAERFPSVHFDWPAEREALVLMVGGPNGLAHVMRNLLTNACEGDGERGAQHVRVVVDATRDNVVIEVRDDGPGFPAAALASGVRDPESTKPEGSGLGLAFVRRLLEQSDGRLTRGNGAGGGAFVRLELRHAEGGGEREPALPRGPRT